MAGEISKRNGQKGGRPKGKKNQTTLEKEAILEAIKQRIFQKADQLIGAQFSIAEGCSYLFEIIHYKEGKEKKSKHVLVKDPEEIKRYLDGDAEPDKYYFITTDRPDDKALANLLDRAFGKPKESVELSGGLNISKVLDNLEHDGHKTLGQTVAPQPPLQNPR
jgi:uncharacterized protein YggU (UPF0235/DUF167 family)